MEDAEYDTNLTQEHYYVFGYITHVYAKIEVGLRFYLGWRLGIPADKSYLTAVIAAPYSALDFRRVVKALHKELPMEEPAHTRFTELLGEYKSFSKLRNNIAHNLWTAGARPKSIKPMFARISEEKLEVFGADEQEQDYLIEDLSKAGKRLEKLQSDFIDFFTELGVVGPIAAD